MKPRSAFYVFSNREGSYNVSLGTHLSNLSSIIKNLPAEEVELGTVFPSGHSLTPRSAQALVERGVLEPIDSNTFKIIRRKRQR